MATSSRKSTDLLPEIFQTERNKKFLSATIDQLVEPTKLEKLSAYVGQRYRPSYRSSDVFLQEASQQRQDYQLEPTVTYKSDGSNIDYAQQYIDFINEIEAQGGSSAKHDRLFDQKHYSYAPPIDADKFVNYRQYYWLTDKLDAVSLATGEGATVTFGVGSKGFESWTFTHKSIDNPDIIVYKGNTYNFDVSALGKNFWIKTKPGTGTDNGFDTDYVDNNGTDNGTVTLRVPAADSSTTNPHVLYYQCEEHSEMLGRIIIQDLANHNFDPDENIVGVLGYTDNTGFSLSSGMQITFPSGISSTYASKTYYVENVGKYIILKQDSTLEVVETYTDNTAPDYWTINRGSDDGNAWSRYNRWHHIDVINTVATKNQTTIALTENLRAKRPIIEFLPGIELYNHGLNHTFVDVIDTTQTDAFSRVQGTAGYIADGVDLTTGTTVVFTADPEQKDKIYTVELLTLTDSTQVVYLQLAQTITAIQDLSVSARKGTNNKGKTYWFNDNSWQLAQQKTAVQQKPLFDVYNSDATGRHNSLADKTTFPSSTFTGSTLFEIATDSSQGTPDTVYGTNVIYDKIGLISDIRINDTFNSDTFKYTSGTTTVTGNVRSHHFHIQRTNPVADSTPDYGFTSLNNWKTLVNSSPQKIVKIYKAEKDEEYFLIDQYVNANSLTDLVVEVLINGVRSTDYSITTINDSKYVQLGTKATVDDIISVKVHSKTGTPSGLGFFEPSIGWQKNPLNENVTQLTLGDMIEHFTSASEQMPNFTGTAVGANNSRDINTPFQYGSVILQHSGSVPLASVFLKDTVMNIPKAMRFAGREYEKFKNQLIDNANAVSLDETDEKNLDRLLRLINANKSSSFPFYKSDMLGYGDDKNILSYTVTETALNYYPISTKFVLSTLSEKAVYVYLNDTQLIHGQDYTFTTTDDSSNQVGIEVAVSLSVNDVLKIVEHNNTFATYIPPTPAKLGLAPKYKPEIFNDTSYQPERKHHCCIQ
jgi:hypothetical protein